MSHGRWPVLLVGVPAMVAVWSGWVGLGEMTGFGLVEPLPGIWDGEINTAITLPIGIDAYGIYALSVATRAKVAEGARRYAWLSAGAAMLLGMGAQASYHVLKADGATRAPDWVTVVVACTPVLMVFATALLWHVAGDAPAGKGKKWTLDLAWTERALSRFRSGVQPGPSTPAPTVTTTPSGSASGTVSASSTLALVGGPAVAPSAGTGSREQAEQVARQWLSEGRPVSKGALAEAARCSPSTAQRAMTRLGIKKEAAA